MEMHDRYMFLILSTVVWLYYQPLFFFYSLILVLEMAGQFLREKPSPFFLFCPSFSKKNDDNNSNFKMFVYKEA